MKDLKAFWLTLTPWKKFKLIMTLLLVIYVIIFAIVNWERGEVNFVFFQLNIPITLLISICLVIGYLSSSLFDYRRYKLKEREIQQLKTKIEELRAKPAEIISE